MFLARAASRSLVSESDMRRWWRRDPWHGIRWRERRRLDKLSKSGQLIEDPQDRQRVQVWMEYMGWFYGTPWWRLMYLFLWLVIPAYAIGAVFRLVQGNTAHAVWDSGVLVVNSLAVGLVRNWRRNMRRTAAANGWRS